MPVLFQAMNYTRALYHLITLSWHLLRVNKLLTDHGT